MNRPALKVRCHARRSGDKQPCSRWANRGMTVCQSHGGATPAARRKADQRIALSKAAQMVVKYEGSVSADPLSGLINMITRAAAQEACYRDYVMQLPNGPAELVVKGGATGGLAPHPFIEMWSAARKELGQVCKLALDAGIAQKQVDLATNEAQFVASIVALVVDRFVAPHEQQEARRLVAEQLRMK